MSRAYRVRVQETLRKVICAEDHVSCQLELLEILPCEQMASLLGAELAKLGFAIEGETATRQQDDVTITVDLPSANVVVRAATDRKIELKSNKDGHVYDDRQMAADLEDHLRRQAKTELEKQGLQAEALLQRQVTDKLEASWATFAKNSRAQPIVHPRLRSKRARPNWDRSNRSAKIQRLVR